MFQLVENTHKLLNFGSAHGTFGIAPCSRNKVTRTFDAELLVAASRVGHCTLPVHAHDALQAVFRGDFFFARWQRHFDTVDETLSTNTFFLDLPL